MAACALFVAMLLGCGATPPPKELVDARSNYSKAEKGLSPKLAPAELDTAKQALDKAEGAFEEDPESPQTKHLSYIADRKAQLAEVNAEIEQASRMRSGAEEQFRETTVSELEKARKEAAMTKEELKDEREKLKAERQARQALEKKLKVALESLHQVAAVKEEARGVVITLSGAVLFASGKSQLLPIAKEKLDQVIKALADQGHPSLVVEGHTDSTGSHSANMTLSQSRADAVVQYLTQQGYPGGKIKAVGIGPDRPVADNSSPDGRANNRRVEMIVGNK
jgi:outer membrane protein OmpA-like peptidoglycan-associated protein